ncbi:hypothetical protein RHGRI_022129 [Rhododendron griersonianum]|uniref:Uncharacterized protein n=1 Tax=Rhododendron griersonianum TaxID=479676 RepID=A0AAV6JPG7_9ERIC|nr:hypothetical protein RHGRI_022129 [Rhododendron griersonianum]
MMPQNMQPNMAQGGTILPFSPSLCPTRAGFGQFFNNFPTSRSNMPSLLNSKFGEDNQVLRVVKFGEEDNQV